MKSQMSRGSKYFIDSLPKKADKEKFTPFMRSFELSCVMGELDDALMMFPFEVDEKEKEGIERVYNYIRQVVLSKLGQKLLVTSFYKDEKSSQDAITTLVRNIVGEEKDGGSLSGAKKIIFELQDND